MIVALRPNGFWSVLAAVNEPALVRRGGLLRKEADLSLAKPRPQSF
jgi:hypothetical protein